MCYEPWGLFHADVSVRTRRVGTTIGLRNYRSFVLFLLAMTVLDCYALGCSLAMFLLRHQELQKAAQGRGQSTEGL